MPFEQEVSCPVGGEKFSYVGTGSCSYSGGNRRMSFWTPSTCDFITRLPVCPSNKLPLYKDFSADEIEKLKKILKTKTYRRLKKKSRFFRAYQLERQLNPDAEVGFAYDLLLGGLWYDEASLTHQNEEYLSAFFLEAEAGIEQASSVNKPFDQAIVAYFYYRAGDQGNAKRLLEMVKLSDAYQDEPLQSYVNAIEQCISNKRQACSPGDRISPGDND